MKCGRPILVVLLLVAFRLAVPAPLTSQERGASMVTLTGVVEDLQRSSGINSAVLRFEKLVEDGDGVRALFAEETVAGSGGRFTVRAIERGTYRLSVRALGYATLEEEIEVTGEAHIHVALVPEAIELEPVVVVSRRSRYLQDMGFYDRRESARPGSTFTYDEIQSRSTGRISDILRTIAGVTVRHMGLTSPVVLFRAGCVPDLVIDGINLGTSARIDDMVRPNDVEGLEVHRGTTILPFANSMCGSLVVWTIDPSAHDDGKPWSWRRLFAAAGITALSLFLLR
jgi:hypothetical protein